MDQICFVRKRIKFYFQIFINFKSIFLKRFTLQFQINSLKDQQMSILDNKQSVQEFIQEQKEEQAKQIQQNTQDQFKNQFEQQIQRAILESEKQPFDVLFIGVCGGTSCGKTLISQQIQSYIEKHSSFTVNTLKLKHFYKDVDFTILQHFPDNQINYDDPFMINDQLLYETLQKLAKKQDVEVKAYNMALCQHTQEIIKIQAADVIILDGIYSLQFKNVRNMLNIRIFVDSDAEQRLLNRVKFDTQKKHRNISDIINYYRKFVQPAYQEYVVKQKKYCTNIVSTDNIDSIKCILEYIQLKLINLENM